MKRPQNNAPRSETFHRTTALADAFVTACARAGIDVSGARLPTKREPTWRVRRKN